jgi:hypothetical protein
MAGRAHPHSPARAGLSCYSMALQIPPGFGVRLCSAAIEEPAISGIQNTVQRLWVARPSGGGTSRFKFSHTRNPSLRTQPTPPVSAKAAASIASSPPTTSLINSLPQEPKRTKSRSPTQRSFSPTALNCSITADPRIPTPTQSSDGVTSNNYSSLPAFAPG